MPPGIIESTLNQFIPQAMIPAGVYTPQEIITSTLDWCIPQVMIR